MIRVFLVDDQTLVRKGIRSLFAHHSRFEVVGEAENGSDAVRLIESLEPDLLFLDIEMPELTGLEVLERVTQRPAVIFTTAYDRYAVSAFELGALDYLLKPFGRERFLTALERARRALEADDESPVIERARGALTGEGQLTRLFVRDRELQRTHITCLGGVGRRHYVLARASGWYGAIHCQPSP